MQALNEDVLGVCRSFLSVPDQLTLACSSRFLNEQGHEARRRHNARQLLKGVTLSSRAPVSWPDGLEESLDEVLRWTCRKVIKHMRMSVRYLDDRIVGHFCLALDNDTLFPRFVPDSSGVTTSTGRDTVWVRVQKTRMMNTGNVRFKIEPAWWMTKEERRFFAGVF